jgi:hypothetical protein
MADLFSTEDHPREQQEAQATIQHVVDKVAEEVGGSGDIQAARDRLEAELEARGLSPQPEPWLGNAAVEIAAGRPIIVDRRIDPNIRERTGTMREGGEGGENAPGLSDGDTDSR